jgi:hypothetical protein
MVVTVAVKMMMSTLVVEMVVVAGIVLVTVRGGSKDSGRENGGDCIWSLW